MAKISAIFEGECLPYDEYLIRKAESYRKRSEVACPMFITDTIEIRSMADGEMYTSKSRLRQTYKDKGLIEVGNESVVSRASKEYKPEGVKDDLRKAISQLR